MTAPRRSQADSLLKDAAIAFAAASRCREQLQVERAATEHERGMTILRQFDELPADVRDDYRDMRAHLDIEQRIVAFLLDAHNRTYDQNVIVYEKLLVDATRIDVLLRAQVLCCFGCILIFEGSQDEAINVLAQAQKIFAESGHRGEASQASFHTARALVQKKQRATAVKQLEELMRVVEDTRRPVTRYELAALLLLAVQYRLMWQRRRSKSALDLAHYFASRNTELRATQEGRALKFIKRWGLWTYIVWPKRGNLPLV